MMHDRIDKIVSNPYLFTNALRYREGYRYCVCGVVNTDKVKNGLIGRQNF
jgi:hypothetical protein